MGYLPRRLENQSVATKKFRLEELGDFLNEFNDAAGVTPFVVIPRN